MSWIRKIFKKKPSTAVKKVARRQLKNVKSGEIIQVEWSRAAGGFCYMLCLNNDPKTEKILLEASFTNGEKVKLILRYDAAELRNFNLLNSYPVKQKSKVSTIAELEKSLKEAIEKEEFEKAEKIKKMIEQFNHGA